jgi:hypothetical protein
MLVEYIQPLSLLNEICPFQTENEEQGRFCRAPTLTRGRVCRLSESVSSISQLSISTIIYIFTSYQIFVYTLHTRPLSVQAQYSRLCPISSNSCYNGSIITWTVVCLIAAKFNPLIFSVSGFTLSNVANIFIIMNLLWLLLVACIILLYNHTCTEVPTAFRPALVPTQPPIPWEPGKIIPVVKRPGRDDDHSH